jgi:MraZ protein
LGRRDSSWRGTASTERDGTGSGAEAAVKYFSSTYTNKVDQKGRVSIPAPFRKVLASDEVVLFQSLIYDAVEGSAVEWLDELNQRIQRLPQLSRERAKLEMQLADSQSVSIDKEGRIVLPESFMAYAGIAETAVFVGSSDKFRIWEPKKYAEHRDTARAEARQTGVTEPAFAPTPAAGAAS